MSDDVDDIFDEKEPAQPEVAETPAAEPNPAEAAQPEAEPKGDEPDAPPASKAEDGDRNVPYGALKDERTKRQALERELQEMREWRQRLEAQQREARLQQIEDPDERLSYARQLSQQEIAQTRLQLSRQYAERVHGAETVNAVVEFFNDPVHAPMSHQFAKSPDPFGAAVEYYNAQQALREIGPDPKSYREKLRDELRAELLAELNPAKPKAPPRSMASAPAAGGKANPIGSGFDALFGAQD